MYTSQGPDFCSPRVSRCSYAVKPMSLSDLAPIIFIITGSVIGFAAGFLGLQGAFLLVPVQYWIFSAGGLDPDLAIRLATGTSLAVMLPVSIFSAWGHHCRGSVSAETVVRMGGGVFTGALLGAGVATFLPGRILAPLFGIVVILSGAVMIRVPEAPPEPPHPFNPAFIFPLGVFLGIVTGLTGIAGAVVVPVLLLLLGMPIHRAVGTANALVAVSCAGGVLAYLFLGYGMPGLPGGTIGYVSLTAFLLLALPAILLAAGGVRVCHRLPPRQLRIAVSLVMVVIGLQMTGIFGALLAMTFP
jgi:uncharacterized protein